MSVSPLILSVSFPPSSTTVTSISLSLVYNEITPFCPTPPFQTPAAPPDQPLAALPPLDTSSQGWWSSLFASVCGGQERTDKEGKGERDSSPKGSDNTERWRKWRKREWKEEMGQWYYAMSESHAGGMSRCWTWSVWVCYAILRGREGGRKRWRERPNTNSRSGIRPPLHFSSVHWSLESFE